MNIGISRRAPGTRPAAVLAGVAAMAAGLAAAPASASPGHEHKLGNAHSITYTYTGGEQTFVVPTGVTSINVTAIGAAGGDAATPAGGGTGGIGGEGEEAASTLTVTPHSTLYVEVGGVGGIGTTFAGGEGGFNGGAAGAGTSTGGGGGGGASDVRTISDTGVGTLTSREIVAAGGGGAGGGGSCLAAGGGNGGSSIAVATTGGACPGPEDGGGPGLAGAAGSGGAGGLGGPGTTVPGGNGTVGAFGTGGASASEGSGGGGGGWYGGGGGGGAGLDATGPVWGGGGGGGAGSSLGTDLGPTPLAAQVVITYTPPPGHPDLSITLKHPRMFVHHWIGAYAIWIANTGTGGTSHTTTVQLNLPRGITMVQGGRGTFWTCQKSRHASVCSRRTTIGAGEKTLITARVKIHARVGKTLYATATVGPTDKTPKDNTSTDKVIIRKSP